MPGDPIVNTDQNTITYNVVLDPGDIARQAEEIRNQLDLALGVGSNAGVQFVNTADVVNPQFAPLPPPDFTSMQGQFGNTVDQTFWQRAQEQISNTYQNLSTGLDRMQQDLSMAVERTRGVVQRFQTPGGEQVTSPYAELLPETLWQEMGGMTGLWGGDITGPIAPSTYQKYAERRFGEGVRDIFQNPGAALSSAEDAIFGDSTLGTVASMGVYAIPYVGQALFLADMAGMTDEWLSGAYNKREDLAGGIREIARQQFGNITKGQARDIAQNVVDYTNSYQGYAQDISLEEVSQNLLQFGNMGGFDNVRNTEQLQEKISSVVEDTRQIARNLGIFQEDAVNIMAELERTSMVNVENMRSISDRMRFYGGALREDPVQLLQESVGMMQQFRQGPVEKDQIMQSYLDARVEAQNLIQSTDPYVQQSVYRLGGAGGVTQTLMGLYNTNQQGPYGDLMTMGQFFGGGTGGNLNEYVNQTAGGMQNYGDWLDFQSRGQEDVYGHKTVDQAALDQIGLAMGIWKNVMGQNTQITPRQLEGILMTQLGDTRDQARVVVERFRQMYMNPETITKENLKAGQLETTTRSIAENQETTFWGTVGATLIRPIDEAGRMASYWWGKAKSDVIDWAGEGLFGTRANLETGEIEQGWLTSLFTSPEGSHEVDLDEYNNPIFMNYLVQGDKHRFTKTVDEEMRGRLEDSGDIRRKVQKEVEEESKGKNLSNDQKKKLVDERTKKEEDKFIDMSKGKFQYSDRLTFLRDQYDMPPIDYLGYSQKDTIFNQIEELRDTNKNLFYDDQGELLEPQVITQNLIDSGKLTELPTNLTDQQRRQVVFRGIQAIDDIGKQIPTEQDVQTEVKQTDRDIQNAVDQREKTIQEVGIESKKAVDDFRKRIINDPKTQAMKETDPALYEATVAALQEVQNLSPEELEKFSSKGKGHTLQDYFEQKVKEHYNASGQVVTGIEQAVKHGFPREEAEKMIRWKDETAEQLRDTMKENKDFNLFFTSAENIQLAKLEKTKQELMDMDVVSPTRYASVGEQVSQFNRNFISAIQTGFFDKMDADERKKAMQSDEYRTAKMDIYDAVKYGDYDQIKESVKKFGDSVGWDQVTKDNTYKELSKMVDPNSDMYKQEMPFNISKMQQNIEKMANKYLGVGNVKDNSESTATED